MLNFSLSGVKFLLLIRVVETPGLIDESFWMLVFRLSKKARKDSARNDFWLVSSFFSKMG